jgi:hypothetical protein
VLSRRVEVGVVADVGWQVHLARGSGDQGLAHRVHVARGGREEVLEARSCLRPGRRAEGHEGVEGGRGEGCVVVGHHWPVEKVDHLAHVKDVVADGDADAMARLKLIGSLEL